MPGLRLIQLSDSHIREDPDARYRGTHALDGLKSVVRAAADFSPDAVIATGDLSDDGTAGSYALIREALLGLGAPVVCLPGNHDLPEMMRKVFLTPPFSMPPTLGFGNWRLHFLDSTVPETIAGHFDAARRQALLTGLDRQKEPYAAVFLHHQPLPVGSPWIDCYPLMRSGSFRSLVAGEPRIRLVAWGHIHHDWRRREGRVRWLGCPSTVANSLPGSEEFTPDDNGPACRWLELGPRGGVRTGVLYPPREPSAC